MPIVTHRTLNILAALVWYGGGVILFVKGTGLILGAERIAPDLFWHWAAGALGVITGAVKARYLFAGACRRNLRRIASIRSPRPWQFYRPWFFAVLFVLAVGSARLSRLADGSYAFLSVMGFVDLGIGVALLGSGYVFWKEGAFRR